MNVILRGIKMPIKCGLCPCFHAEWPMYCQAVKADKNKRIVAPYGMPRPEWCPLIELPPHGRLGDLDALWAEISKICDRYDAGIITDLTCLQQILSALRHAPTIIPAEEEAK